MREPFTNMSCNTCSFPEPNVVVHRQTDAGWERCGCLLTQTYNLHSGEDLASELGRKLVPGSGINTTCLGISAQEGNAQGSQKGFVAPQSSVPMPWKQAGPQSSVFTPREEAAWVRIPGLQRPSLQQVDPCNSTVLRLKGGKETSGLRNGLC